MRILFFLIILVLPGFVKMEAQTPEKSDYQAIARSTDGAPLAARKIRVRIAILDGGPEGTILYSETHRLETLDKMNETNRL